MKWSGCRGWFYLLIPALGAVVLYLPAVKHRFVWDDVNLIVYDTNRPFDALRSSFGHSASAHLGKDPYYRPLVNFSFLLGRLIFRDRPVYFHLENALVHGVITFLFALLLSRLTGSEVVGGAAGLLFGLHPLLVDSVTYISGRTDLFAALGSVVAILGIFDYLRRGGAGPFFLAVAGFIWAVFSKESAVTFLLVAGVALFSRKAGSAVGYRPRFALFFALVLVAAVYAFIRFRVLGTVLGVRPPAEFGRAALVTLNNFGYELGLFFFPFRAQLFSAGFASRAGLAVPGLLGVAWLLLPVLGYRIGFSRWALVGWAWSVVTLLPFGWVLQFGPAGRLLYLPGLGVILMAAVLASKFLKKSRRVRLKLLGLCLVWCAVTLPVSLKRMGYWRDEVKLFSRMVSELPGFAPGYYNLGMAFLVQGDTGKAIRAFGQAVAIDSGAVNAALNLGVLLQKTGKVDEARALYRHIIKERPDYAPAYVNLGLLLYRQGAVSDAVALLRTAVEKDSTDAVAFYNLARLYLLIGQRDSAHRAVKRACRLQPGEFRFQRLLQETGR